MMTIEWTKTIPEINLAPHRFTMMTAPEANTKAIALPPCRWPTIPLNTLHKDLKKDIEGPDLDSEHVHDSDAIHELLMDIHSEYNEGQVDTWSGGIPGGIPKTTTVAP
jgi:hypothetical protein